MSERRNNPWTDADLASLAALYAAGNLDNWVAFLPTRTFSSITAKAHALGIRLSPEQVVEARTRGRRRQLGGIIRSLGDARPPQSHARPARQPDAITLAMIQWRGVNPFPLRGSLAN